MENQTRMPKARLVAETPEIIVGIAAMSDPSGRQISQQADDAEQHDALPAMDSGSRDTSSCQRAGHNELGWILPPSLGVRDAKGEGAHDLESKGRGPRSIPESQGA